MTVDGLDLLLILAGAWRRLLATAGVAVIAAVLATTGHPWVPPSPGPPLPPPPPPAITAEVQAAKRLEIEEATREVADVRHALGQLSPRDSTYWTARERVKAATVRLREALAPPPPAPPPPPLPRGARVDRPWPRWMALLSAALGGLLVAAISVWIETWWRAALTARDLATRRRQLAELTGRR